MSGDVPTEDEHPSCPVEADALGYDPVAEVTVGEVNPFAIVPAPFGDGGVLAYVRAHRTSGLSVTVRPGAWTLVSEAGGFEPPYATSLPVETSAFALARLADGSLGWVDIVGVSEAYAVHLGAPDETPRTMPIATQLRDPSRALPSPSQLHPDPDRFGLVFHAGRTGISSYECNEGLKWVVVEHEEWPSMAMFESPNLWASEDPTVVPTPSRERLVVMTPPLAPDPCAWDVENEGRLYVVGWDTGVHWSLTFDETRARLLTATEENVVVRIEDALVSYDIETGDERWRTTEVDRVAERGIRSAWTSDVSGLVVGVVKDEDEAVLELFVLDQDGRISGQRLLANRMRRIRRIAVNDGVLYVGGEQAGEGRVAVYAPSWQCENRVR